jgi:predicted MPP superfamily phosphohydrolase
MSDIHMRESAAWSQDVVLKALCDRIARQQADGIALDFILATGDLAFSAKADEYELTASFFDALSTASGVAKERIFCIPGNHDIDRERQKLWFLGARSLLQNQNWVDLLLSPGEDLEPLLKREENYRNFQASYFKAQDRACTADGLGYVSSISLDSLRIAIIGLDSAWLAEGGVGDYGKLLIGERQVINAIEAANILDPHIVIAMSHHPLHLLLEFDRQVVQNRIQRACQFFHCGHLHEPDSGIGGYHTAGCLTLSAGASFETRQTHNTFSIVTLDLLHARSTVDFVQYNPKDGLFSFTSSRDYPIKLPAVTCSVAELAQVMKTYSVKLSPWAHYLSALLLDQKAEFPISAQKGHAFGSFDVIQGLPDSDLKHKTSEFMAFKNVLRVFYKSFPLPDIFVRRGAAVEQYGDVLRELGSADSALAARLAVQEEDSKKLANTEPHEGFSHTIILLKELATAKEWILLRDRSQRHTDSPDPTVAIHAKRMLALGLAHSDEATDKKAAIEIYRRLTEQTSTDFTDAGNLAILLMDGPKDESRAEAKALVLDGIRKYPIKADYYYDIGQRIVEATGDRSFRQQIEILVKERGKRG